jgi:hypothetical protein
MSIDIFLYIFTATSAHLVMSLGQTLFHWHLGHRSFGGIFFRNHVHFHHAHYSGDHIVSVHHGNNEGNNTPFFLIPTVLVVGLSYLFMRFDLFVVQLAAMSLSFYAHVYLDKQYHLAGSRLDRFSWFKRKQQLHFIHHRHANHNFAVIDYFWDRLLGTYRGVEVTRQVAPDASTAREIASEGKATTCYNSVDSAAKQGTGPIPRIT